LLLNKFNPVYKRVQYLSFPQQQKTEP